MRGRAEAASRESLVAELTQQGLLVNEVRQASSILGLSLRRTKVRPEDLLGFAQEVITLLRAGLTVPDTLEQLQERPGQAALASAIGRVFDEVNHGVSLSTACSREPQAFDGLFVSALATGERTGDLADALEYYCRHAERGIALRRKFSQAMAYPMFLLITVVVVLTVLFVFVLPRFVSLYANLGVELPMPTRVVMRAVDTLPYWLPALLLMSVAVWYAYKRFTASAVGHLRADRIKARIPLYGPALNTIAVIHATRALSAFLSAGTPLVEAMHAVSASLTNRAFAARMTQATTLVSEGVSLAAASKQAALFPAKADKLIAVGEASGALDAVLAKVAEFYEMRLDHNMSRLVSIIEPALMLLVGVFIGGIIVVMYLPVFGMAGVIR